MSSRRCRTCPALFQAESGDQCDSCLGRSSAIAVAIRPSNPPQKRIGAPPKSRTCETDGHHACPHFQALLVPLRDWVADCDWCVVCAAEVPQDAPDGAEVQHKPDCALAALIAQALDSAHSTPVGRPCGTRTSAAPTSGQAEEGR